MDNFANIIVNPKAGAIFRLLVGNAGIRGEFIPGGVLVNPLPINQTSKNVLDALVPVQNALESVTAPPEEAYLMIGGEQVVNPRYTETGGQPQPKIGYEQQFYSLKALISALGVVNNAMLSGERSLKSHTDRVINNILELTGLAQAYTQSIQKIGIALGIRQRTGISPDMEQVPNAANRPNLVSLGGLDGTIIGVDPGFNQIPKVISPEVQAGFVYKKPPVFSDIGISSYNNYIDAVTKDAEKKQIIKTIKQLENLDRLLDTAGISKVQFPTNVILAEVNQAAHAEELFKSILPEAVGGEGQPILNRINKNVNLFGVDLMNVNIVQTITNNLNNLTSEIKGLVSKERANWSEEMLHPPIFPNGRVMEIITQVARCEGIVFLSNNSETQGILSSCVSELTTEILKSG
jgi:hypothetical protein